MTIRTTAVTLPAVVDGIAVAEVAVCCTGVFLCCCGWSLMDICCLPGRLGSTPVSVGGTALVWSPRSRVANPWSRVTRALVLCPNAAAAGFLDVDDEGGGRGGRDDRRVGDDDERGDRRARDTVPGT